MISSLPGKALRTLVVIARLVEIKKILGECLLISSLHGEALRPFFCHCEACRANQHAFSKPSLVNLISKGVNLVFLLSVESVFHSSN